MRTFWRRASAGRWVEGTLRRIQAASAFVSDFGIATECGIGRARTAETARAIIRIHAEAAEK